ncbi:upstream activation factor subunit UAF30, partial [Tremellales sp. Uapishka_1]
MATPTFVTNLLPRIRELLEKADLSTMYVGPTGADRVVLTPHVHCSSAKGVRKQLVADGEDPTKIKEYRDALDLEIGTIYEELTAQRSPSPASSEPDVPIGQSSQPVRLNLKKETKPKVEAETDEEVARRLQREFDGLSSGRASRQTTAPRKEKVKKVKRKREVGEDEDDGEGGKKKRGGGGAFNKEMLLSDALRELTGEERLSRPQTVKRLWEYIKGNELQDPADKRYIRCDERMKRVFHTDRLHMMTMNKYLGDHLRDPDLVVD